MLKNILSILSIVCLAASCSPSHSSVSPSGTKSATSSNSSGSIQFINGISIKPDAHQDKTGSSVENYYNGNSAGPADRSAVPGGPIENYPALQFKYAILENASVEELNNPKLLIFMEYWYGAPYHYGGTSRDGIDCSAFAFLLMSSVYGVAALPRTSKEQYDATRHIRRNELQEGDLVFFHTLGRHRTVTHVGVYLRNNKFIHASISGVMISDMNDGYYDQHFVGAGRVLTSTAQASPVLPAAGGNNTAN